MCMNQAGSMSVFSVCVRTDVWEFPDYHVVNKGMFAISAVWDERLPRNGHHHQILTNDFVMVVIENTDF